MKTKEDFEKEYERLYKWRELWQRLSNRDSQVYPQKGNSGSRRSPNARFLATLQTRDERIQHRAQIKNWQIGELMRKWDELRSQPLPIKEQLDKVAAL